MLLPVVFFIILIPAPPGVLASTEIKVALITPEGSTWTNSLYQLAQEVKTRTAGEVNITVYAGGISGDELDVLRKMQVNRIHAAGFSGVGLGVLLPEIRILEAPLLFRDYAEVDLVKDQLAGRFAAALEEKGFILLGFAEAGFVYFFSTQSMVGPRGFDPLKMWVWKGDPVAKTSLEALGIEAIPLQLPDVNTGLETGMINSFYSPPLAAIAFQWYAKIRFMLDYPMVNSTGAFLIKKSVFESLSEENRTILKKASLKFCNELIRLSRKENKEAREVLQASGIVLEKPTPEVRKRFTANAPKIYESALDRQYPRELFEKVQSILEAHRNSGSAASIEAK